MTQEQQEIYNKTVRRLARGGIKDPTAQIIALAEEIERYRSKIYALEERVAYATAPQKPSGLRYTHYDTELGRFIVPCLNKPNGGMVRFFYKTGGPEFINGMQVGREPDVVYGEVIDRLAELENKEEAENYAP